jgi:hypothetical protein
VWLLACNVTDCERRARSSPTCGIHPYVTNPDKRVCFVGCHGSHELDARLAIELTPWPTISDAGACVRPTLRAPHRKGPRTTAHQFRGPTHHIALYSHPCTRQRVCRSRGMED